MEKINEGEQNEITVKQFKTNDLVIVSTPPSYDVYWNLTKNMQDTEIPLGKKITAQEVYDKVRPEIEEYVANNQLTPYQSKFYGMMNLINVENNVAKFKDERSIFIAIPMAHLTVENDQVKTDELVSGFNMNIRNSRKANSDRVDELKGLQFKNGKGGELSQTIKDLASKDDAFAPEKTIKTSIVFGKPEDKIIPDPKTGQDKTISWASGKVVGSGKFYVLLHTGNAVKEVNGKLEETVFIRAINTGNILDGKDFPMDKRLNAINKIAPVGSTKSFNWNPKKKIIVTDYDAEKAMQKRLAKLEQLNSKKVEAEQIKEEVKEVAKTPVKTAKKEVVKEVEKEEVKPKRAPAKKKVKEAEMTR